MTPMLARTLGPKFFTFPCFVQPKLNGVRALYQQGNFQSRDEKIWKVKVLDHLMFELSTLDLGSLILDGELYLHGTRLQDINSAVAVNRKEPTAETGKIEYHVFDVVDPSKPFSERWLDIMNTIKTANLPHIKAVETFLIPDRDELDRYFHHWTDLGYEGIMLRPDGPYEFGEHLANHGQNMTSFRSKFLWKHKSWLDSERLCVGVTQGEGKANIGIGALALITEPDKKYTWTGNFQTSVNVFKVGTGFTDAERVDFASTPPIGKQVKFRYLELTENKVPFNASFLCIL